MQADIEIIRDIELQIPVQDNNTLLITVVVLLFTMGIISIVAYRRSRGRRNIAVRSVKRLARAHQSGSISNNACAYEIAALMQHGLNLTQVSAGTSFPESLTGQRSRWYSFVNRLDQARYTMASIPASSMKQLLRDAEFWLRRWP